MLFKKEITEIWWTVAFRARNWYPWCFPSFNKNQTHLTHLSEDYQFLEAVLEKRAHTQTCIVLTWACLIDDYWQFHVCCFSVSVFYYLEGAVSSPSLLNAGAKPAKSKMSLSRCFRRTIPDCAGYLSGIFYFVLERVGYKGLGRFQTGGVSLSSCSPLHCSKTLLNLI